VRALRGSDARTPQHLGGRVQRVTPLAPDVVSVELQLDRALDFEAGQFALVSVPGIPGARAYSMVDAAPVTRRLTFVVKRKDGGAVSAWLWPDGAARVGTRVDLFAPLGGAVFRPGLEPDVLCLAGGTGLAGMVSILRRAVDADHFADRSGVLIFGVRRARDLFLLDELGALRARAGPRLGITVALSDEDVPEGLAAAHPRLSFARGLVHAVAAAHVRAGAAVRAWLAGPPPMVDASVRLLLTQGRLTPADIRFDKFT
jgi:toluene monooxygenase electron transfer component